MSDYYRSLLNKEDSKVSTDEISNAYIKSIELDGSIFNISWVSLCKWYNHLYQTNTEERKKKISEILNKYKPQNKYNPNYPNFSSKGDCANFVSQCLETGGFKMNEYWHCYPKNPKEVNPLYHLIDRFNNWNCTPAWSAAKDQYEYLKNSNIVIGEMILNNTKDITSAINNSEKPVKIGDIMYLQWDKDYPHHATIISKIENDMIFYAAHTNSQEKKPLSEFFDNNKNGIAYILKIK